MGERITGKVKFFNEKKGFGFIVRDDGKGDVFFHVTALPSGTDEVFEDDKLSFEIVPGKQGKGVRASGINLVA
jgi:CspA family cold shock protein